MLEEVADLALPCGGSGRWPRWERSDRVGWGAVPKPSRFPGPVGGDDRLFVAVGTSAVCLWETFSLPLGGSSKLGSSPFPSAFFFLLLSHFPFKDSRTPVTAVKWMEFSSYYLTGRSLDDNWTLMLTASVKSFMKHLAWGGRPEVEWETALTPGPGRPGLHCQLCLQ